MGITLRLSTHTGGINMAELSQADINSAFDGPAISANRSLIVLGPSGVRIAFVEQFSPEMGSAYRTAVLLSIQDAVALKNALQNLLKDVEAQIAAQASPANV